MKKTDKYSPELLRQLYARMRIERDGGLAPAELFDLVSSLEGDAESVTDFSAVSARDLREDAFREDEGKTLLTGETENGFAVTRFKLTSDTAE